MYKTKCLQTAYEFKSFFTTLLSKENFHLTTISFLNSFTKAKLLTYLAKNQNFLPTFLYCNLPKCL
jgi:hypothetical protein